MGGEFTKLSYSKRRSAWALKHQPRLTGRVLGYRQVQVLEFIRAQIQLTGYAPSYTEIGNEFGIERDNLSRMITALERRGLLFRAGRGKVRRIRLA